MSVIAKMLIRVTTGFDTGCLVELGCVCENDLMAAYATSEEDKLFSKYSPSGDMKLHQPAGYNLSGTLDEVESDGMTPSKAFYVMALHKDEHELQPEPERYYPDTNFPGSTAWGYGICRSVTDFGGTKRVEFRVGGGGTVKGHAIDKLNWKMSVDNPGASNQFKPGECYFIVLYDASKYDRDAAIRAAHGHDKPED